MAKKRKSRISVEAVKEAAAGRWVEILIQVGGIPANVLDGSHHACPKCGGKDRFRLIDEQDGSVLCNQCLTTKNGDGIAAVSWFRGIDFATSLQLVAEFVGISEPAPEKPAPDAHLQWRPWNEVIIALWCRHKPPVTPSAVKAAGGRLARYRHQFTVIAIPVWGPMLDAGEPVGWAIMNTTGGPLPRLHKGGETEWMTKPKLTYGSSPGVIGDLDRLRKSAVVWKLEGVTDVLAWLSMSDTAHDHAAATNANGCQQRPMKWMTKLLGGEGKRAINVLHDADIPGQRGSVGWDEHGRHRAGWAEELAATSKECRNVTLPFPVAETHGKDFRDWLNEGGSFEGLREMAGQGAQIEACTDQAFEAVDDPDRLARMNLERYAALTGGRTICYWRDEYYIWKKTAYHKITEKELRGKIWAAVKAEFDRVWKEDMQRYQETGGDGEDDKPPQARKVNNALVGNVLSATCGMVTVSHQVEQMTWLPTRERRSYLAVQNGILDLAAAIEDRPEEECVLPHSAHWFSEVTLPYAFDSKAECPQWKAFLNYNLDNDQQRVNLLQEWAGYLLLPDTGEQMFMILEGDGANGKSVYCGGVEAMLGSSNCSYVQLELFGDRFSKTQTLGKLVNICGDVGEIDKVAEGTIKAFASGNTLYFDRKGIGGVSCTPTARLMMACNNRPRFSDRTDGIWRRMLLVPWLKQISKDKRIRNMDKPWFWAKQGELPGMLNWALVGLHRLKQFGFTECDAMNEAIDDYKCETNTARYFLTEFVEADIDGALSCDWLYTRYNRWAIANGYRPLSSRAFGRELFKAFPECTKRRLGPRGQRWYAYSKVALKDGARYRSPSDDQDEEPDRPF